MRRVLVITFALVLAFFGTAPFTSAQAATTLGSIAGRAVNASGGALAGQRVDLVRGAQVVNVAMTDTQGNWTFQNVEAGEYVVRTSVNGKLAGVRVTVAAGQTVSGSMIVVPAGAVSPQFGALAGLVGSLTTGVGASAASALATVVNKTKETNLNANDVATILNALPADQKVQFAQQVIAAVTKNPESGSIFVQPSTSGSTQNSGGQSSQGLNQQLIDAFTNIVKHPDAKVPTVVLGAS